MKRYISLKRFQSNKVWGVLKMKKNRKLITTRPCQDCLRTPQYASAPISTCVSYP